MARNSATTEGATETVEAPELTQNALAIHAKKAALDALIENHAEEWATLYGDEREARGLAREAGGESLAIIQERYNKRKAKLEEDERKLRARGVVV